MTGFRNNLIWKSSSYRAGDEALGRLAIGRKLGQTLTWIQVLPIVFFAADWIQAQMIGGKAKEGANLELLRNLAEVWGTAVAADFATVAAASLFSVTVLPLAVELVISVGTGYLIGLVVKEIWDEPDADAETIRRLNRHFLDSQTNRLYLP